MGEFQSGGDMGFRRWLPNFLYNQWLELRAEVMALHLTEGVDKARWGWGLKGNFTVKAGYDMMTRDDIGDSYTRIWKTKIPYKIKIFLWLVEKRAILTKDNLIRRKW
jgi:hypothetical protein